MEKWMDKVSEKGEQLYLLAKCFVATVGKALISENRGVTGRCFCTGVPHLSAISWVFFREWRARGRRQLVVVHSVIQPRWVFHGFFCTSSLESFLMDCGNSKSRHLRLTVPALFSNSKPSLSKKLTKPNSEEYSPACPHANIPLQSQRSFAAEKGTTPTGDYWNKPAHSLPTTNTVEKDLFPHCLAQTTNSVCREIPILQDPIFQF
ncbi:hypothetical protein AMECASPLE_030918 [Ameca splendens]|uniref:Uncharacterized protein n=1 Tax=Ameca splendens TaxID=208324 RepID=A0ABV0XJ82_9TELE